MLTVRYFSWVRERMNRAEERVAPPASVATVGDLIAWLLAREDVADLGIEPRLLKAAVDARLADHAAPIAGAAVVALFPPMTGG